MVTLESKAGTTPPLKRAVAFIRPPEDVPLEQRDETVRQQETAFARFCTRHGFLAGGTFPGPVMGPEANGSTEGAYQRLRSQVSRDGDIAAVAMARLETLADEPDTLALYLLELESLGAKAYLFSGQTIDATSVLSGTWPQPAKTPVDMGIRIKDAMRNRAIRGEGLGKPPYGYKIGPRKKLEVVPDEAGVVRLIYSLYTQQNQGIRLIVRHLNEHNIVTRKGRNWSMVTIRDILRNRAYLGTYTRFGMRVPGSHPAIITPDQFRWTQERLEQRTPSRKAVQAHPFLLSGLIYCDACGNRMMGVTRRQSWTRQKDGSRAEKEYRYYQCQSRTNQGVCSYQTQNAQALEARVLERLVDERARLASVRTRRPGASSLAAVFRERKRLQTALATLQTRLRRSIKQVQAGKLSLLRFRPTGGQLLQSRREMLDRLDTLAEIESTGVAPLSPVQTAVTSIDALAAAWPSMELLRKRTLLSELIERIGVKGEDLAVVLRPALA